MPVKKVYTQCKREGCPPEINVPGHPFPGMNFLGHSALAFSSILCPMDIYTSYECPWTSNTGVKCSRDNYN